MQRANSEIGTDHEALPRQNAPLRACLKCTSHDVEELERETGIEPATNGLGSRYSTIELLPLDRLKLYRTRTVQMRVSDLQTPTLRGALLETCTVKHRHLLRPKMRSRSVTKCPEKY